MRSTPIAARRTDLDLAGRVAALEQAVARLERRAVRVDPPAGLLSAIAAAVGSTVFTARDLVRYARHDRELADVVGETSPRRIGVWLRRLHQHATAPYELQRVARDGTGAVWVLRVDADRHTQTRPPRVAGADSEA